MAFDFSIVVSLQDKLVRGADDLSRSYQRNIDTISKLAAAAEANDAAARRITAQLQVKNAAIEREALRRTLPRGTPQEAIERLRRIGGEYRSLTQKREDISSELQSAQKRKNMALDDLLQGFVNSAPADEMDRLSKKIKEVSAEMNNLVQVDKSYGATQNALREEATSIHQRQMGGLKALNMIIEGSIIALLSFARSVAASIAIMRQAGQSYAEIFQSTKENLANSLQQFIKGKFVTPEDEARIRAAAAARGLGQALPELQPGLRGIASRGGDVGAATQFASAYYQANKFAKGTASEALVTAAALERATGTPLNVILREGAQYADLMANAANRNAQSFLRTAIEARRLNVDMRSLEASADRLTGDFETFLTSQAQLQAVLPGVDLSGAMIASQYGDTGDILESIQAALGGRDIGELPRSIRNLVARSFGLSVQDLVNIGAADEMPPELQVAKVSESHLKAIKDYFTGGTFTDHFTHFEERIGRLMSVFGGSIFTAIGKLVTYLATYRFLFGGAGRGLLGSVLGRTGLGAFFGAALGAPTRIIGSIFNRLRGLLRFGGGAAAATGGAAAAAAGGAATGIAGRGLASAVGRRIFAGVPLVGGGLEFIHGMSEGRGVGRSLAGAALTTGLAGLGSFLGPLGTIGGGILGSYLSGKFFGKPEAEAPTFGEFPGEERRSRIPAYAPSFERDRGEILSEVRTATSAIKDLNSLMRNMKIVIEMDNRVLGYGVVHSGGGGNRQGNIQAVR